MSSPGVTIAELLVAGEPAAWSAAGFSLAGEVATVGTVAIRLAGEQPGEKIFRLGEAILEVVEHPPGTRAAEDRDAPCRFYGLAFLVDDLDATARTLGPLLGEARDAVQPGRRIATVRREARLGLPVAFMPPA